MNKVFVYKNLHKDRWSLRDVKTKLVTSHRKTVALKDATFKVSEAGRKRVLKERRKNVHAGIQGTTTRAPKEGSWIKVSYNPYKWGYFYKVETGEPIYSASYVKFEEDSVFVLEEA
jgi:hypothetical protein